MKSLFSVNGNQWKFKFMFGNIVAKLVRSFLNLFLQDPWISAEDFTKATKVAINSRYDFYYSFKFILKNWIQFWEKTLLNDLEINGIREKSGNLKECVFYKKQEKGREFSCKSHSNPILMDNLSVFYKKFLIPFPVRT